MERSKEIKPRQPDPSKPSQDSTFMNMKESSTRDDPESGKREVTTEVRRMFRTVSSGVKTSPIKRPLRRKIQKRAISAAKASKMKPSGKLSRDQIGTEDAKVADDAMHAQEGASKMVSEVLEQIFEKNKRLSEDYDTYRRKELEYEEINTALRELLEEILGLCRHYAVECDVEGGKWNQIAELDTIPDFLVKLIEHLYGQGPCVADNYIELVKQVEEYEKQVESKGKEIQQAKGQLQLDIIKLKETIAREEEKLAFRQTEIDRLKVELTTLQDERFGDAKRRKRAVDDIQGEIEYLRNKLQQTKDDAAKAQAESEKTIADLRKQISDATAKILELEGRRGGIRDKIDEIRDQLDAALKELERLKADRLLIIDVIQRACTSAFYERLFSDMELDPKRPIDLFLERLLKALVDDLQKAWSIAGKLEMENRQLTKARQEAVDPKAVKDVLAAKYGPPAKDLKADTDRLMRMIGDLTKDLEDANRAKQALAKETGVGQERLEAMLTECTVKYDAEKANWDKVGDDMKKKAMGLMEQIVGYQQEIDKIRAGAGNTAAQLQQKEEDLLRLQLNSDTAKLEMSAKLSKLDKEAASIQDQIKKGRVEDQYKLKQLAQKLERATAELDALQGQEAERQNELPKVKALAEAMEKDIGIEQKKRKDAVKDRDELQKRCDQTWLDYENLSKDLASKKVLLEKEISANNDLSKRAKQLEALAKAPKTEEGKQEKENRLRQLEKEKITAHQQTGELTKKLVDMQDDVDRAKKAELERMSALRTSLAENQQLVREVGAARAALNTALGEKAHVDAERNRLRVENDWLQYELSRFQTDSIKNKERLIELQSAVFAAQTAGTVAPRNVIIRRYRSISPYGEGGEVRDSIQTAPARQ